MELDHTRQVRGDGCMNGGRRLGSCVAGRSPRPRQPMLDLRQQSHHHRGQRRPSSFWIAISATARRTSRISPPPTAKRSPQRVPPVQAELWVARECEVPPPRRTASRPRASGYPRRSSDTGIPGQRAAATCKARVAVEQASRLGWERYIGREGCVIRYEHLGAAQGTPESSASRRTASWQSRRNC